MLAKSLSDINTIINKKRKFLENTTDCIVAGRHRSNGEISGDGIIKVVCVYG
jgi:hypothetical protein